MSTVSDEKIISSVLSGRTDDFELLVGRYEKLIFFIALKYTKEHEEAKSLASEVLFTAYRALPMFRGGNFKAFLTRITINRCNDWARAKSRERAKRVSYIEEFEFEIASGEKTPEEEAMRREEIKTLCRHIEALPEKYRRAAYLTLVEGRTAAEVANLEQENQKTIESRVRRAKEKLRNSLKEVRRDGG